MANCHYEDITSILVLFGEGNTQNGVTGTSVHTYEITIMTNHPRNIHMFKSS